MTDETTLPDVFDLHVERKHDGWWLVTAPEYPGLFVAHPDLNVAMSDVALSLATLLRLNGEVA